MLRFIAQLFYLVWDTLIMIFVWGEAIGNFIMKHWFWFVWNVFVISIGTIVLSLPVLAKAFHLKQGLLFVWKGMDGLAKLIAVGK